MDKFCYIRCKINIRNNENLLHQLTQAARASGLRVEQSALAYKSGGRIQFYGDENLVRYLSKNWIPHWTHTIDV